MFVEEKREGETTAKPLTEMQQWWLDAAQYIRTHGWCQGHSELEDGRVCLAGGLARAGGYDPNAEMPKCHTIRRKWSSVLAQTSDGLQRRYGVVGIAGWNDARGRTKEQVIEFLEDLAKGEK